MAQNNWTSIRLKAHVSAYIFKTPKPIFVMFGTLERCFILSTYVNSIFIRIHHTKWYHPAKVNKSDFTVNERWGKFSTTCLAELVSRTNCWTKSVSWTTDRQKPSPICFNSSKHDCACWQFGLQQGVAESLACVRHRQMVTSYVDFVFTRDSIYAIARICYGNSVCLSVCLSHGWISQKWLKLGSRNFHHTVAPSL